MSLSKVLVVTNTATADNTITVTLPSSPTINAGDLMVLAFVPKGGTNNAFTDVSGAWTNIASNDSGTNISGEAFSKVAGSSENSTTYSFEIRQGGVLTNRAWSVGLIVIRGDTPTVLSSGIQVNGFGSTCTAPSVSLTGASSGAWALMFTLVNRGTTVTPDADYSETDGFDVQSGANTTDTTLELAIDTSIATSGSTGTQTSTLAASAVNIGIHIVVYEAGSGTSEQLDDATVDVSSPAATGKLTIVLGSASVSISGPTATGRTNAPQAAASVAVSAPAPTHALAPYPLGAASVDVAAPTPTGTLLAALVAALVDVTAPAASEAGQTIVPAGVAAVAVSGPAATGVLTAALTSAGGAVAAETPTGALMSGLAAAGVTVSSPVVTPAMLASLAAAGVSVAAPTAAGVLVALLPSGQVVVIAPAVTSAGGAVVLVLPLASTIAAVPGLTSTIAAAAGMTSTIAAVPGLTSTITP